MIINLLPLSSLTQKYECVACFNDNDIDTIAIEWELKKK